MLSNTNNSIQHYSFVCTVKLFQVLLWIPNNSIKHQSCLYTQLNEQTVLFQTIQSRISHLFVLSLNVNVKVTYLGIRSAHERVWLVEEKPIWLPRAYLTRGDLEPVRGNVHVCKLVRELTNIQIRTVTAERR